MKFFETPLNKTDALMGCPLHWKSESLPSLKNKAFFQEMIPKKFQISKILSTIIICVSLIYETTLENTESLEPHDSPLMYWLMPPPRSPTPHHHIHTHTKFWKEPSLHSLHLLETLYCTEYLLYGIFEKCDKIQKNFRREDPFLTHFSPLLRFIP